MLAAFKLGAVPINVNYRYVEEELRYLLDDADARAVVFHREFAPKLAAMRDALPGLGTFIVVDDGSDADADRAVGAVEYEAALSRAHSATATSPNGRPTTLYILYTGGTTGMPKGVMWRHEDVFFGAMGGASSGAAADHDARGDRRTLPRAAHSVRARVPVHARHRALDGLRRAVQRRQRRHPDPSATSTRRALGADRRRAGELPRHRRRRVRPPAGRGRSTRLDAAPLDLSSLARAALGRRDPVALGEAGVGRTPARHPRRRRLRRVGDRRSGPVGQRRRRRDRIGAPLLGERPRPRCSTTTCSPSRPASSASWPAGATSRSATTRIRRRPRRRSPWSTACAGRCPATTPCIEDDGTITAARPRVGVDQHRRREGVPRRGGGRAEGARRRVRRGRRRRARRALGRARRRGRAGARPALRPTLDELAEHVRAHVAGYKVPRDVVLVDAIVRSPSGKPDYRWARAAAGDGNSA